MTAVASLSYWARLHRVQARILVGFITSAIMLLGAALGNLWMSCGLSMGPGILAAIFVIYLAIFPLYPVIRRRTNWVRRKTFDVTLISCTALLGVWLGVQGDKVSLPTGPQTAQAITIHNTEKTETHPTAAHRFGKKVQRGMSILRLVFRRPVRFADDPYIFSTGAKIGLTILAILLMAGLMAVLASISCSLSCSGNAVGGTLVLVLGWAAVITLGTFAIIRIHRKAGWRERRAERIGG